MSLLLTRGGASRFLMMLEVVPDARSMQVNYPAGQGSICVHYEKDAPKEIAVWSDFAQESYDSAVAMATAYGVSK